MSEPVVSERLRRRLATMPPTDNPPIWAGVSAGSNRYGFEVCPICRHPGDLEQDGIYRFVLRTRDAVDAYRETGLCQDCQDAENA